MPPLLPARRGALESVLAAVLLDLFYRDHAQSVGARKLEAVVSPRHVAVRVVGFHEFADDAGGTEAG